MSLYTFIFNEQPQETPKPRPGLRDLIGEAASLVNRRFSRGGIAAQFGQVLTEEQMEEERDRLRKDLRRAA